jgi:ketosteroid isomerase-like protein
MHPLEAETLVREFYARWSAADVTGAVELLDEDVAVRPVLGFLVSRSEYRGRAGFAQWDREIRAPYDVMEARVEAALPLAGEDRLLAILQVLARRDERTLDARIGVECHLRDGRITALLGRAAEDVDAYMQQRSREDAAARAADAPDAHRFGPMRHASALS